jgi:hypothetical protein
VIAIRAATGMSPDNEDRRRAATPSIPREIPRNCIFGFTAQYGLTGITRAAETSKRGVGGCSGRHGEKKGPRSIDSMALFQRGSRETGNAAFQQRALRDPMLKQLK